MWKVFGKGINVLEYLENTLKINIVNIMIE